MNTRFLEIAKQVGLKFNSETSLSPVEEKFAELIMQECIRAAETTPEMRESGAADRIKEVFGVK